MSESKSKSTMNLRIVDERYVDKRPEIYVSSDSLRDKLGSHYWDQVKLYRIYWKRLTCEYSFCVSVYNPNRIKDEYIKKWLVDLHKLEGAYKAEKLKY